MKTNNIISFLFFHSAIPGYYSGVGVRIDSYVYTFAGLECVRRRNYESFIYFVNFTEYQLIDPDETGLEAFYRNLDFLECSPTKVLLALFSRNYDNCATFSSVIINKRYTIPNVFYWAIKNSPKYIVSINRSQE